MKGELGATKLGNKEEDAIGDLEGEREKEGGRATIEQERRHVGKEILGGRWESASTMSEVEKRLLLMIW